MSKKHLSWLAAGTALVVLAVLMLVPVRTGEDPGEANTVLLPGLEAGINEASGLVISAAGPEVIVTLERADAGWAVAELGGYPADFDVVRPVLAALAQARVVETKTANPDYFDRLGVQGLDQPGAPGLQLDLTSNGAPQSILLGNEATNRKGRYARRPDGGPALLTDFDAALPEQLMGWVNDTIVDQSSEETARVEIIHADGETLSVARRSADDTDFTVEANIPDGRSLKSSWSVNSLGGVFAGLRFEAVQRAEALTWTAPLRVSALGFSGLQVSLQVVSVPGQDGALVHWARVHASAPYAEEETDSEAAAVLASEVARLNERTQGWAYQLVPYQFESMSQRTEDLLEPLAESTTEAGG